jgi:curli production assembly/transport component CsgG
MVKIGFFAALIAIVAFAYSPLHAQERASLAVFPALIADAARPSFGEGKLDAQELTQQIEEALRATRRFAIFERSAKILQNSVLLEQEFAKGGQALNNAAEAGKLANVQFIAQPIITQVDISIRKIQNEETPGRYRYIAKGSLTVRIKVIDTTSAEIVSETTRDVMLRPANDVENRQTGAHDEYLVLSAAWRSLAADAATRLTNAIVGSLFPIQVLQIQDADIFVNRGEGGGIFAGEIYQIFSIGEPLIDPVTNEKLGNTEKLLGEVEILRVNPRFSVAHAKTSLTSQVKPGDILRPPP